ncbi:MAG: amidohydrolase [Ginsengibacter sp.]
MGLKEVANGVRASNDYNELGQINPSVRAIVAYNTDSKVINVLRANGILLANVVPQDEAGSTELLTGSSTVVQLDAWNWEDAAYRMDGNIHFNMPSLVARTGRGSRGQNAAPQEDPLKRALDNIEKARSFFHDAKAYNAESTHAETNLKFEATKNLFNKKQKLFIHCNVVKEMLIAIDFKKQFDFDVVIVGGTDSWMIADLLKQNNISVILDEPHSLPASFDDDFDQPYKTPYQLQKAGVLFAINDRNGETRGRNLMFNAGTAATYGLTKEEALSAITLNPAKILGISDISGSLEEGKDANIVISTGDILDMKSSIISNAFIQGREISLENKQTQLYKRYQYKYGQK